jgi:hypothetical protein
MAKKVKIKSIQPQGSITRKSGAQTTSRQTWNTKEVLQK